MELYERFRKMAHIQEVFTPIGRSELADSPRMFRHGVRIHRPSALTLAWKVENNGKTLAMDQYLGSVQAERYRVAFRRVPIARKTYGAHSTDIRFETIASWARSVNERRRQNRKMLKLLEDRGPVGQVMEAAKAVFESHELDFLENMRERVSLLVNGDTSLEKFKRHALEHKHSSFGGRRWQEILDNPTELSFLWRRTNSFLQQYHKLLHGKDEDTLKYLKSHELKADLITVAVRSRPGALKQDISNVDLMKDSVEVIKHRDRAAGGVPFFSQFMYPLDELTKKKFYRIVQALYEKILGGRIFMPELDGATIYKRIIDNDYVYFDTANAEKVEVINPLIVEKVGLHEAGIPSAAGTSKMSGGSETRSGGNLGEVCLDRGAMEAGYMTFLGGKAELLAGGDNKAGHIDVDPDIEELFSPSSRFLGWTRIGQTLHITSDGVLHNVSVGPRFRSVEFRLKILNEYDLAQSLLPTTIFGDDVPRKFLDIIDRTDLPIESFEAGNFVNELDLSQIPGVIDLWNELKEKLLDQYVRLGVKLGPETKFVQELK